MEKKQSSVKNRSERGGALRRLEGWRRRVVLVGVALLAPLLVFLVVEIALRLFGFGWPTGFFTKIPNRETMTTNQQFGWRYFPKAIARTPVVAELSPIAEPDTFRIFVIGGSAAMGTPDPAFGVARVLQTMLDDQYPGIKFEVINAAMTAINSHVALPITRDCAALGADLFIVYLGNNEVVGPYGAAGVLAKDSASLGMIRTAIAFRGTKWGQLLAGRIEGRRGQRLKAWQGMEMFLKQRVALDDAKLNHVYKHFRRNLEDMVATAREHSVPMVLSTVSTNLLDSPPFASMHRAGLTTDEEAAWEQLYSQGQEFFNANQFEQALEKLEGALAVDEHFADLRYLLGLTHLALNHPEQAKTHFVQARDLDTLRFRADSEINSIIREVAARHAQETELLDADQLFQAASSNGIPGGDYFHEHVHFNFGGNYLLARNLMATLEPLLPEPFQTARRQGDPLSANECAQRLNLTAWDGLRIARDIFAMTGRPPFTNQLYFDYRRGVLSESLRQIEISMDGNVMAEVERMYDEALAANPNDLFLHSHFAEFLEATGRTELALAQWHELNARIPTVAAWHTRYGLALSSTGKFEEAVNEIEQAMKLWPGMPEHYMNLGSIFADKGDLDSAQAQFQKAINTNPSFEQAYFAMAGLHHRQVNWEIAAGYYRDALRLRPDWAEAHYNLGICLVQLENPDEAIDHYRKAVYYQPGYTLAYFNLADTLAEQRRIEDAALAYLAGLRLQPENFNARQNLALIYQWLGMEEKAIVELRQLASMKPDFAPVLNSLAWLLINSADPALHNLDEGVRLAETACRNSGRQVPEFLTTLAVAYQLAGKSGIARQTAREALDLAKTKGNKELGLQIQNLFEIEPGPEAN